MSIALKDGIQIVEDAAPEFEAVAAIQRGLHNFNQETGGPYDREPVTLLVQDGMPVCNIRLSRNAKSGVAAKRQACRRC